jgi:hypothetical protein
MPTWKYRHIFYRSITEHLSANKLS